MIAPRPGRRWRGPSLLAASLALCASAPDPAGRPQIASMLEAGDVRLMTVPSQGGNDAKVARLVLAARAGAGTVLSAPERARLRASVTASLASSAALPIVPFQIDSAVAYIVSGQTMLLLVCTLCGYGTLTIMDGEGQATITTRLDTRGIVPQAR